MAWRDQYQPGSFRGVPFVTTDHSHDFGRRGEGNEYPYRDAPFFEDIGRKGEGWSVQAFVIGPNYMDGRDALLAACKAQGPGTLVHPFLGTFQAQLVDGRLTESTAEGGMARFDLHFVEPGIAVTALQAPDTQTAAADTADTTDASATARFGDDFDVSEQAPFVADAAASLIDGLSTAAASAGMLLGGAGTTLRAFQIGLSALDGAGSLIFAPLNLAAVVIGMVGALGRVGTRPVAQVAALQQLMLAADALPAVATPTPSRARQAANQQAVADLVIAASAGAAVRAAASAAFSSYDDAVALRDSLGDDLDTRAVAAADRGNDALAADLDLLRRAMIVDVTARGGSLAHVFGYTPKIVSPSLVIAWKLYRDPVSLIDQAADIVTRNRIRHPGFVPIEQLAVLTATAVSDG